MSRRPTCECGICRLCHQRWVQRQWTERNREKTREMARSYRERNIELVRERDRARGYREYSAEKAKARRALNHAVASGKVKREPCEVCGSVERVHGHHDDYSKPLDVRWLCSKHHGEVHRVYREEAA